MSIKPLIEDHFIQSNRVKEQTLKTCADAIEKSARVMVSSLQKGNKILLCGNGGSAADAQHMAAELVVRLSTSLNRPALAAIALTTDSSILTAGGNDLGFDQIFARQIEALGKKEDVLIAISTSGNSSNILNALRQAKAQNLSTIAILGKGGGQAAQLSDVSIIVPSDNTQYIQETHITIAHILCEIIEQELFA